MAVVPFNDGIRVGTTLNHAGATVQPGFGPDDMAEQSLQHFGIPWDAWRVWDAIQTNLPGTPATDDLGLLGNTFGTGSPTIETGDLKAAGATTRYARAFVFLPHNYNAAADVVMRFHAGMKDNAADTSATLDMEAYKSDEEAGIGSDLCATAAIDINSTSLADRDFTITATSLSPGDMLDIRIAIAVNDAASGSAVTGQVGMAWLLCDTKG